MDEWKKWQGYWKTSVGKVVPNKILVRGYPLDQLIGRLSFPEGLYLIFKGELPTPAQGRMLEALLFGIFEHAFINSAIPAARYVVAGNPAVVNGAAAGILSMGPYTGSPRAAAEFIQDCHSLSVKENLTPRETAEKVVADYVGSRRRIPGFGHPVHNADPRTVRLREIAEAEKVAGEKTRLYETVHEVFLSKSGKKLPINTDGMMAALLLDLGFTPLEIEAVAIVSFLPGILAHTLEEIQQKVPLRVIPDAIAEYTGSAERNLGR
jgi:citrate synthase